MRTYIRLLGAAVVASAIVLAAPAVLADTVIMKDGRTLEGVATEAGASVFIDMKMGRVKLNRSEVQEIVYQKPATTSAPVGPASTATGSAAASDAAGDEAGPFPRATRPDTLVFVLMRKLALVPPGSESVSLRQSMDPWRVACHDGVTRSGSRWIKPAELKRLRENFDKVRAEGEDALRKARSGYSKSNQDKVRQIQAVAAAQARMQVAASNWGDPIIRSFLLGELALEQDNAPSANALFRECIRQMPLVAGFYQGRAMALTKADRHLEALADYAMVLRLRDDDATAYFDLVEAMKRVPGGMIKNQAYTQAEKLVNQYVPPTAKPTQSSYGRGVRWLMPGGDWQANKDSLATPAYDYFRVNKAVALPIGQGLLLVDANAIAGAAELMLELSPGRYVRAEVVKLSSGSATSAPTTLPIAAVRVKNYSFMPTLIDEKGKLASGDELTLFAQSLPEELDGPAPRKAVITVSELAGDGTPKLSGRLLPGESAGPLLNADGKLVGFLAGRTDPMVEAGGPNTFISLKELAPYIAQVNKAAKSSSSFGRPRYGAPAPKSTTQPADGQVFTLHAIIGVGGPEKKR